MRISDWSSDVCSSDLLAQRADDPERLNLAMGEHIDLQVTLHGARLPSAEVPQSRDAGWSEKVNKSLRGCLGDRERAISEAAPARSPTRPRSEEHTSELQSLMRISYAVFCLKKKINT